MLATTLVSLFFTSLVSAENTTRVLKDVLLVGNNWDGTATVIESVFPYSKLGLVNLVPDLQQRLSAIKWNPLNYVVYKFNQIQVGKGHDQLVDDLYASPDGNSIVASRPSLGDVVSINLETETVNWRFPVPGFRSDHMAISPDGERVLVSASFSKTVCVLNIKTGELIGKFPTGQSPHENFIVNNSSQIWNVAIGINVFNIPDSWKGDRHITVVDYQTLQVLKTIDMRSRLNAVGLKDFSNAVRPGAFNPDWTKFYFQVSFFNGILEYDVQNDNISRTVTLPSNPLLNPDRSTWLLNSRHHGLSITPDGRYLCAAGTMDNYTTIVNTANLSHKSLVAAQRPYWATVSGDAKHCIISESAADVVTAIDFESGEKVVSIPVGTHPQRVRIGRILI